MLDMDTIGYFLFMSEEERKTKETQENRSTNEIITSTEEEPGQRSNGEKIFFYPET